MSTTRVTRGTDCQEDNVSTCKDVETTSLVIDSLSCTSEAAKASCFPMFQKSLGVGKELPEAQNKKYYWELGRNLPQEILHRRECGREAYKGAQNFRNNERRAKSRLFMQQHVSDPSRFYREATRHTKSHIVDVMAAALMKRVVLSQSSTIVK